MDIITDYFTEEPRIKAKRQVKLAHALMYARLHASPLTVDQPLLAQDEEKSIYEHWKEPRYTRCY